MTRSPDSNQVGGTDRSDKVRGCASFGAPAVRRPNPAEPSARPARDDTGSRPASSRLHPAPLFTAACRRRPSAPDDRDTLTDGRPGLAGCRAGFGTELGHVVAELGCQLAEEMTGGCRCHVAVSPELTTDVAPRHCRPLVWAAGESARRAATGRPWSGWFPNNHPTPPTTHVVSRTPNATQVPGRVLGNRETPLPPARKSRS